METISRIYKLFLENPVISTDSRKITKGSIFFALKGENFDGNKYANDALNAGCVAAIVDDPEINHPNCIYVENVLTTLQTLSNIHRKSLGIKVIGITGSNGKTTTKELIYNVLKQKYNVHATVGNLNNHIGVPLTLLSLTKDTEIAIVEMGANHPGEIMELAKIAEPDYGLITNIGRAHLGGFGSFEGVKKTKGELYEYISINGGVVFYNAANDILNDLIKKYSLEDYAIPYGYGYRSISISKSNNPFLKVEVINHNGDSFIEIQTSLVGSYNFENVYAAMTVGKYMGVPVEKIRIAIESYTPSNSRSQLVKTKLNTLVLDAYNANPTSMENALENFSKIEGDNKIVMLGEMLELGEYSDDEHKRIVALAKSLGFSSIYLVGKGFGKFSEGCLYFGSSDDCANYLLNNPIQNSVILVKGSRGVKLEKVVPFL